MDKNPNFRTIIHTYVLWYWQINQFLVKFHELWKILKDPQEIYRKFFKNLMIWVSLRVLVLLKYEVWVWAVLTLCQYGTRTDTLCQCTLVVQVLSIFTSRIANKSFSCHRPTSNICAVIRGPIIKNTLNTNWMHGNGGCSFARSYSPFTIWIHCQWKVETNDIRK